MGTPGKRFGGFTLIELIMVVTIIGFLAAVSVPRYFFVLEDARRAEAMATMNAVREAQAAHVVSNGGYSDTFPISCDLNADGTAELSIVQPESVDLVFSIQGVGGPDDQKYVQAARRSAGIGRQSYSMCFVNGKTANCSADSCPITCP